MPTDSRAIEDFTWCIQSPPLMQFEDQQCWPDASWFHQWNTSSMDAPSLTEYKLGLRFEAMVAHWITQEPSLSLLAKNLPVHDGQRTVGEFDLIVDNAGCVEHWELAVKFYLGTGDTLNMANWHGPDPSDTLARKIHRMNSHQLKLSQHVAGEALLLQHGWKVEQVRSLVKGRLFHPFDLYKERACLTPKNVSPDHEKGWWLTDTDFRRLAELKNAGFTILERQDWLTPLQDVEHDQVMNHSELVSALDNVTSKGTLHIARIEEDRTEQSRGFIVFPGWLQDVEQGRQANPAPV